MMGLLVLPSFLPYDVAALPGAGSPHYEMVTCRLVSARSKSIVLLLPSGDHLGLVGVLLGLERGPGRGAIGAACVSTGHRRPQR